MCFWTSNPVSCSSCPSIPSLDRNFQTESQSKDPGGRPCHVGHSDATLREHDHPHRLADRDGWEPERWRRRSGPVDQPGHIEDRQGHHRLRYRCTRDHGSHHRVQSERFIRCRSRSFPPARRSCFIRPCAFDSVVDRRPVPISSGDSSSSCDPSDHRYRGSSPRMDDTRNQEKVGREKGQECAQAGRVGGDRRVSFLFAGGRSV